MHAPPSHVTRAQSTTSLRGAIGFYSRPSSRGMSIVLNFPDVVCSCQMRSATPSTPLVTWSFGIEPGLLPLSCRDRLLIPIHDSTGVAS